MKTLHRGHVETKLNLLYAKLKQKFKFLKKNNKKNKY